MSDCNITETIYGSQCIGDTLPIINSNFGNLDTVACELSGLVDGLTGRVDTAETDIEVLESNLDAFQVLSKGFAQIRLSPSSSLSVVTSDTTTTNLYIHPYNGNIIGLYNTTTSKWEAKTISSVLTFSLNGLAANTNYNVYLGHNGSSFQIQFEQWGTTFVSPKDDGATSYLGGVAALAPALQDGVRVYNSDRSYRFVGCLRTTTADTTEVTFGRKWVSNGSHPKFFIWNTQNQVPSTFSIFDNEHWHVTGQGKGSAGDNGPFSNFGYRNNTGRDGSGNRVSFITGDTQVVELNQDHWSSGGWAYLTHGLNLDHPQIPEVIDIHRQGQFVSETQGQIEHTSKFVVPAGFHFVQELAMSYGGGTYWVYEGTAGQDYPGGRHSYGANGSLASY